MNDSITNEAIAWFARVQSDCRTRADEDRFAHWLKQDPRHEQAYARVAGLWRASGPQITPRPLVAEEKPQARTVFSAKLAVAASLVALAIGAGLFFHKPINQGSFATAAGVQRQIKLGDGSMVTLNTRSEVRIDISDSQRTVRLTRGEARFNVAKDPLRPFIVEAGSARVRALGTEFDVRISSARVDVTLVEGRVEVLPIAVTANPQSPVILSAGQQLAVASDGSRQHVQTVPVDRANAWLHRQIIFDAVLLPEAVDEVNRYLAEPLVIEDPSLADMRVSGVVRAGSLESFVGSLESSFPVQALERRNGSVLVRKADEEGAKKFNSAQ